MSRESTPSRFYTFVSMLAWASLGCTAACGSEATQPENTVAAPVPSNGAEPEAALPSGAEEGPGGTQVAEDGFIDEADQSAAASSGSTELSEENACEAVSSQAEVRTRPMDIVVVIDNSGSMDEEIASVERNINVNFAEILNQSGIDYRLVMFSGYRSGEGLMDNNRSFRVCVEPPLGPSPCAGRTPEDAPHGERFFHFDQPIGSTDAQCLLLSTLKSAPLAATEGGGRGGLGTQPPVRADDPLSQAGWSAHLRPDALKAFIMIGDDTVDCQTEGLDFAQSTPEEAAINFDGLLRAASPELFGSAEEERKYAWHSIVGLTPKAQLDAVYEAAEGVVTAQCETAEDPGEPHQAISILTGGLRYPVCNAASYDSIFRRIATEIVEGAALPCSWQIPSSPAGQTFDKDRVNLAYTPGDGSPAPELGRVDGEAACATSLAWYYDDAAQPTAVHACPAACERFTQDATGKVDLLFGCATKTPRAK